MQFGQLNTTTRSKKLKNIIKMYDLILNIDNKEILNEILHHSVDFLIGVSKQNASTSKFCHKFGFSNQEEFENAVHFITNLYRKHVLQKITDEELISHFAHFNQDFQQSVLDVIQTRRPEVESFLVNDFNSKNHNLLASFDWDLRWVMGTNNLTSLRTQIVTLILNCNQNNAADVKTLTMEMNTEKLDKLIEILEECDKKLLVS